LTNHGTSDSAPLSGLAPMPAALRAPVLVLAYAGILLASSYLALALRFDFEVPADFFQRWVRSAWWILALKLALLGVFGQYRSLLTFFSFPDAKGLFYALGVAFLAQFAVWFASAGSAMIPRGTIVVDFVLSFAGLAGFRAAMRAFREGASGAWDSTSPLRRVAIIGAGDAGAQLAREIQSKPGLGMRVVCFIDDDPLKIGRTLHGIQVLGGIKDLPRILSRVPVTKCLLAIPGAKPMAIKETVALLNQAGIDHDILPSVDVVLEGRVAVNLLRHVSPEDLLGREPVPIDQRAVDSLVCGEIVLVTGAGGSIGSELCRQLARHRPGRLVLVERSEPALFVLEQELVRDFKETAVEPVAADVCDREGMGAVFQKWKPAFVFHAAAHKHVPLMERQPAEAVRNNSIGTLVAARAAAANGCRKFVLVSTDKAVNPAGVMGASKYLAELVVGELQSNPANRTAFCSVRFGNVLDSSGSVLRVFRNQIAAGGPVTVTHPEIERYFMSIPEAVGLILQSAVLAEGGEVLVLEMGEPVKIRDLARQMVELSGLVPDRDIAIEFTGLRPGEKLREETTRGGESSEPTIHPKIHKLASAAQKSSAVIADLEKLSPALHSLEADELRRWLAQRTGLDSANGAA
jgi:FlaA1/EpsC-like NDP-sugar epimerase